MMRLVSLAAMALVAWVAYTSLFGNAEEKQMRDDLLAGVKLTGSAVGKIFNSERTKYNKGMYDKQIDQVDGIISTLAKDDGKSGVDFSAELGDLQSQKAELEEKVRQFEEAQAQLEKAKQLAASATPRKKGAKPAEPELDPNAPTQAEIETDFKELQGTLDKITEKLDEE